MKASIVLVIPILTLLLPAAVSFSLKPSSAVCNGKPSPCIAHTVTAGQTLEQVAALHGTTTWQLRNDNLLLESGVDSKVPLRTNDVLAARPSPGPELLRWQWTNKEGAAMSRCLVHPFSHGVSESLTGQRWRQSMLRHASNMLHYTACKPAKIVTLLHVAALQDLIRC
jgi:hypothetical protein